MSLDDLIGKQVRVKIEQPANPDLEAKITEFELLGKPICRIINWRVMGSNLHGRGRYLYGDVRDHPRLGNEDGVSTSRIIYLNMPASFCETANTLYILGRETS